MNRSLLYPSRLTGATCIAFFASRIASLQVLDVEPLLTRPELLSTLEGFDISPVCEFTASARNFQVML